MTIIIVIASVSVSVKVTIATKKMIMTILIKMMKIIHVKYINCC